MNSPFFQNIVHSETLVGSPSKNVTVKFEWTHLLFFIPKNSSGQLLQRWLGDGFGKGQGTAVQKWPEQCQLFAQWAWKSSWAVEDMPQQAESWCYKTEGNLDVCGPSHQVCQGWDQRVEAGCKQGSFCCRQQICQVSLEKLTTLPSGFGKAHNFCEVVFGKAHSFAQWVWKSSSSELGKAQVCSYRMLKGCHKSVHV